MRGEYQLRSWAGLILLAVVLVVVLQLTGPGDD